MWSSLWGDLPVLPQCEPKFVACASGFRPSQPARKRRRRSARVFTSRAVASSSALSASSSASSGVSAKALRRAGGGGRSCTVRPESGRRAVGRVSGRTSSGALCVPSEGVPGLLHGNGRSCRGVAVACCGWPAELLRDPALHRLRLVPDAPRNGHGRPRRCPLGGFSRGPGEAEWRNASPVFRMCMARHCAAFRLRRRSVSTWRPRDPGRLVTARAAAHTAASMPSAGRAVRCRRRPVRRGRRPIPPP
ncbi:hypothetical protein FBY22_3707 [Streptomyces sp. SLBN-31]|nr:hypothetical protein FBY22_3707 [Streptomyces sp. SLBN-31]